DRRAWRTTTSCLGHPVEHGGSYAILDVVAAEEIFQIIRDDFRNLVSDSPVAGRDVGSEDRSLERARGIPDRKRFQRIGDVESAAKPLAPYFPGQSREINQASAGDIDDDRAIW